MFFRDSQDVGFRCRRNGLLVTKEEVLGITVIIVGDEAIQNLAGSIEAKDKAVRHCLLRRVQFLIGYFGGPDQFDLLADRIECSGRRFSLGASADSEQSRMIETGS